MEKISKYNIAENLKLFYIITELARANPNKTYLEIYYALCDKFKVKEKNLASYQEIITTSILVNIINMIGIVKDEMLSFMKKDNEINGKLSFLDKCFVNGCDPADFNRVDVIKNIRNALFHSESKDLYSVKEDFSININMPGESLYLHIDLETLRLICNFVYANTQRAFAYTIEDQKSINTNKMLKDDKSCVEELSKVKIKKIQNKNKASETFKEKVNNLPQQEMSEIENFEEHLIDSNKPREEFIFSLTPEQCQSIAKELMLYKKSCPEKVLSIFINQIILSSTEHGILKYDKMNFDTMVAKEILYSGDYTFMEMCTKLNKDLFEFVDGNKTPKGNFFGDNFHNYGKLNGDVYKIAIIYILRLASTQSQSLGTYYAYVYTNLLENPETEEEISIRNAFTHKRYCWLEGTDSSNTSICLYDNGDDIRHPVGIQTAKWSKTYKVTEMNKKVEEIYLKKAKKEGLKSGVTLK